MDRVILFTSYYFADKADSVLREAGLAHQLIATPPEIHEACGLAVRCESAILHDVLSCLQAHNISRSGVYTYKKGCPSDRVTI